MRRTTGTLATIVLLGALAGCGSDDSDDSAQTGTDPAASDGVSPDTDTSDGAAGAAAPCPDELAEPSGGAAPTDPAAEAPQLPDATAAWVCEYRPGDAPDGPAWTLAGGAVEVDPADLPALDGLEPAAGDRFCTEEIGPRWMLVLADDTGEQTGVVVDDFGCGDVTLTEDPATTAPGSARQDTVEGGALSGPEGLAGDLAALHAG